MKPPAGVPVHMGVFGAVVAWDIGVSAALGFMSGVPRESCANSLKRPRLKVEGEPVTGVNAAAPSFINPDIWPTCRLSRWVLVFGKSS
jgi:hypothetical protein